MKKIMFYFALLVSSLTYAQENPEVKITADTTKIRIGEQIKFQIAVYNAEIGVEFGEIQLDSLGKLEVVEAFDIDTIKDRLIKRYLLTSFDSGSYLIPSQQIRVFSQLYTSDSVRIDVSTVATDTIKQPMFPIKAVQGEPFSLADLKAYIWWILGGLLLLALILYFIFRKKPTPEEIEAKIPPYEFALKRLNELDQRQLWQKNKIKLFYVELTDIVRTYIERELKIPALESTTDELIESMEDFKASSELDFHLDSVSKLKDLLQDSDLVKFAKYKPLSNEIEIHRQDAEKIIEMLHPKEIAPDETVG